MTKGLILGLLIFSTSLTVDNHSYQLNDIQFEINSDKLGDIQEKGLETIIKTIRTSMNEEHEKTFTLWINGHADSSEKKAKRLSDDRANIIKQRLLRLGLTEGTLIAKGYGTKRPLTNSNTDDSRKRNARVEFKIGFK